MSDETDAPEFEDLKDTKGRTLRIRNLDVLDQCNLILAIGPEQSDNERFLRYAQVAWACTHIDGVRLPVPTTQQLILSRVKMLGDAGMLAISRHQQNKITEANAAYEKMIADAEANGGSSTDGPLV
jgi:hypothetical protein